MQLNIRGGTYMKLSRVTGGVFTLLILLISTAPLQAAKFDKQINSNPTDVSVLVQNQPVGIVNTGALNVRTGPAVVYEVVGIIKQGETVALLGRNDNGSWVLVRVSDGLEGWVNASYLQTNTPVVSLPVSSSPPPTSFVGVVNTGALNVRYGPGISFEVITVLKGGDTIILLGRSLRDPWLFIQSADEVKGWVNGTYLITNIPISSLPVITEGDGLPQPPQPPEEPSAIVITGAVNVRTGPSVAYAIITVLDQGQGVLLVGRNDAGSWVQVKSPEDQVGWLNASLVQTTVPVSSLPVIETLPPQPSGVVIAGALNVRGGSGLAFEVVTILQQGETVLVTGRNALGSWVQVKLNSGTTGWVNGSYLEINVPVTTLPIVS
jgi:uncharacterized protein YgiM (DUF1202 family)